MNPLPSVVRWLEEPQSGAVHFASDTADGTHWSPHRQVDLALGARCASSALKAAGARPGTPVLIVLRSTPQFVHSYFGSLAIGCIPTAVEAPGPLTKQSAYVARLRQHLSAVQPCVVVGEERLARLLDAACHDRPAPQFVRDTDLSTADIDTDLPHLGRASIGQLTSGSTGAPKLVLLTVNQVSDHIAAIWRWLEMTTDDVGVSWLPLYHDMGLVGHLLLPLAQGISEYLMQPLSFIRRPENWLKTLSERRGTITAAPTFGYRYVLEKVRDSALLDVDLSACKAAVVGAERVDRDVLDRFASRFASNGFKAESLRPAYGLAEATLAVTGTLMGKEPTFVTAEVAATGIGDIVSVLGQGVAVPKTRLEPLSGAQPYPSPDGPSTVTYVACGPPLPGIRVSVTDEKGNRLRDGTLGEIVVTATWIGDVDGMQTTSGQPTPRQLVTGDAGFMLDGQLYVVGRLGDSLSVRGRKVFSAIVEADIAAAIGRQTVVVLSDQYGGGTVLTLVEGRVSPATARQIHAIVHRHVADGRSVVVRSPRGSIPKTTSGKARRRIIWSNYVRAVYDEQVVSVA